MSDRDVITEALKLPDGARFLKCALQVNPSGYRERYRGQAQGLNPSEYAEAMVRKATELDISVLAITDHNSVAEISYFRAAAEGTDVTILPGFELRSKEGIHVLCIYEPDIQEDQLERYLGEFKIRDTSPSTTPAGSDFVKILQLTKEQGGVSIAAHVTSPQGGLFEILSGESRIRAWQCSELLAVQVPGGIIDLPYNYRQIVENKNSDYKRDNPAGMNQAVAVLNAKDVTGPDDLADGSATCWIKMSENVSIEGLRQAFLDPDSRIQLNMERDSEKHSALLALTWEGGGFLDGTAIHFNTDMNVLIGGRGTGKSTIIESLRYAMDLEPISEDARKTHWEIVRHVLKPGTKLSLLVHSDRPSPHKYRIERTVLDPPVVRSQDGEMTQFLPRDILPQMSVYGQHEISELADDKEKLSTLLERFTQSDTSFAVRKANVHRDLQKTAKTSFGLMKSCRIWKID